MAPLQDHLPLRNRRLPSPLDPRVHYRQPNGPRVSGGAAAAASFSLTREQMSSTEVLAERGAQDAESASGTCRKQRVVMVGWDRPRSILFGLLALSFILWAAIYFPVTTN
ncbi:hypothetical protein J437_LFUL003933 [Ladona fulva]|uniref:Uncharacterized protein n=1 Tax=Ladona fulva TaxID=123851 RepID=A0A8K0P0B2_LADFU|nr:hypothetical protein J437_LFUL003933 [Ladona fulva]